MPDMIWTEALEDVERDEKPLLHMTSRCIPLPEFWVPRAVPVPRVAVFSPPQIAISSPLACIAPSSP